MVNVLTRKRTFLPIISMRNSSKKNMTKKMKNNLNKFVLFNFDLSLISLINVCSATQIQFYKFSRRDKRNVITPDKRMSFLPFFFKSQQWFTQMSARSRVSLN